MERATLRASDSFSIIPSLPGLMGTPARRAHSRARFLSPIFLMAEAGGPMNLILQLSQISAK